MQNCTVGSMRVGDDVQNSLGRKTTQVNDAEGRKVVAWPISGGGSWAQQLGDGLAAIPIVRG